MRHIPLLIYLYFVSLSTIAQQKPIIDTGMLGTWPTLNNDIIASKDGRFIAYTINNQPVGNSTIAVRDIKGAWMREFTSPQISGDFYFTSDNKRFIWRSADSLFIQAVGKDFKSLQGVVDVYKYPRLQKGKWIIYKEKGVDTYILKDLVNTHSTLYHKALDVEFDDYGTSLVLASKDENEQISLRLIDLATQKELTIFKGNKEIDLNNFHFDRSGQQLTFLVGKTLNRSLFYYKHGMPHAIKKLDNSNNDFGEGISISRIDGFSEDGKWIFVKLRKPKPTPPKIDKNLVAVDVWSYRDLILIPEQTSQSFLSDHNNRSLDVALGTNSENKAVVLNPDGLRTIGDNGDFRILSSDTVNPNVAWWPHSPPPAEWIVSLTDGRRKVLPRRWNPIETLSISPGGKWITWWDEETSSWMSYDVYSDNIHNLTSRVSEKFSCDAEYQASTLNLPADYIAGWYTNDEALIIYDNYDIWKIDPAGFKSPVNLTAGYGRKNNIELRLVKDVNTPLNFKGNETLLISGFNRNTKLNGFFKITLDRIGKPELLTMDALTWYREGRQGGQSAGMPPLKVGKNKGWILRGESATEYPNYFYTTDFVQFTAITNFAPQNEYNWLTSELVSWRLPDGRFSQGVLYKPSDFDSTKKYPVIFNYYEKMSQNLYKFPVPSLTEAEVNIPWFVSRGYLVFLTDIHYGPSWKNGISSGKYALNAVESAAYELAKRKYVDSSKFAIQGHSFGGFETVYILTHSNKFAAAAENSGFTDMISLYLNLHGTWANTVDLMNPQDETGHVLHGASLWKVPELYAENSAVLAADKASAPLLIFHNKEDNQVPWRQGLELYMALRRLGKPCWMLQYDGESHVLTDNKSLLDYTIRLTQFFDHYLKETPAPLWMTQGIPAGMKGIETGYAYDRVGNCGKDCKICYHVLEKVDKK